MHLNPDLFFILHDGEIILWDYKNVQHFCIGEGTFKRLMQWSANEVQDATDFDQELLQAQFLEKQKNGSSMRDVWEWDILSYIFHTGTRDIYRDVESNPTPDEWIEAYLGSCDELNESELDLYPEKPGNVVDLPAPDMSLLDTINFLEVLAKRKTVREFYGQSIALEVLSTLLFVSFGRFHPSNSQSGTTWKEENNPIKTYGLRKTSPSGGSLHPIDAYVVCNHVDGLQPGLYYYAVKDHSLLCLREGNFSDQLPALLASQFWAAELSVGIFLTARFDREGWKYPISRAYRVVLLDAGHVSQTFLLTATALGLQTWLTGAFNDSDVDEFLKVESPKEAAVFFVGAGIGSNSGFPKGYVDKYLERKKERDTNEGVNLSL